MFSSAVLRRGNTAARPADMCAFSVLGSLSHPREQKAAPLPRGPLGPLGSLEHLEPSLAIRFGTKELKGQLDKDSSSSLFPSGLASCMGETLYSYSRLSLETGAACAEAYSRLQQVGTWMQDVFFWLSFFLWFGAWGLPCSNFLGSTAPEREVVKVRSRILQKGPNPRRL